MLYLLLAVFLAVQVADLVTTYLGLQRSDVSEANPAAAWLFERIGQLPAMVALKLLMAALGVALALTRSTLGTLALASLTAVGMFVVAVNVRVLREAA